MADTLGMSFEYLDALSAAEVPLYGVSALERQATELRRACDLFLLPAEAIGGGKMQTLKRLNQEICRMSGTEAPETLANPFAELDRKYLHDLAAAQAMGNTDLVTHLEAVYAMEAKQLRSRDLEEEQARQQEVQSSLNPLVTATLKKHLERKSVQQHAAAN